MAYIRFVFSVALVVCIGSLLVACGSAKNVTVNIDAEKNQTTYETRKMRLSKVRGFSGITKPRFEFYVRGQCESVDCAPEMYDLIFQTDPGAGSVLIVASDVKLVAGDERISWTDPFRQIEGRRFETRGTIVTVECTLDQLKTLTSVDAVRGNMGGISFRLYRDNLEPIRSLIQRVES